MKVTITLEDCAEGCAVNYEMPGGFDPKSDACQKANLIANMLDDISMPVERPDIQDVETPRMVLTAEDINARRAKQVAHLAPQKQIIHAH